MAFVATAKAVSGITLQMVSDTIGVSHTTVSRWVNRKNFPDHSDTMILYTWRVYDVALQTLSDGRQKAEPLTLA